MNTIFTENTPFLKPAAMLLASESKSALSLRNVFFSWRLDNSQLLFVPFDNAHRHHARQMKVISLLSSHAHLEAELNHPPTHKPFSACDFSPLFSSSLHPAIFNISLNSVYMSAAFPLPKKVQHCKP